MNSTRWPSLTEFAKHVGREGICRVEETEKGLHIAWIDNSPEALRRQETLRKKERMNKDDEEREQKLIKEQVRRAQESARVEDEAGDEARELQRTDGEKIKLNFGGKPTSNSQPMSDTAITTVPANEKTGAPIPEDTETAPSHREAEAEADGGTSMYKQQQGKEEPPPQAVKLAFGSTSSKPKNVFASKKNPLATKKPIQIEQPKKMSEAERIMREEMERKRVRESNGQAGLNGKRQRVV